MLDVDDENISVEEIELRDRGIDRRVLAQMNGVEGCHRHRRLASRKGQREAAG